MAKKKPNTRTKSTPNGTHHEPERRQRKAIGHENSKRVAALRHRSAPESNTVTTIPSNGDMPETRDILPEPVSIGEAMRRAVEELGETVIDDELAASQMRLLADAYEEVVRRQAVFAAKSEEAKTAKKSLEGAQEFLLERVREFTHPKPLPLFDQTQAEDDHQRMLDAVTDLNHGELAGDAPAEATL